MPSPLVSIGLPVRNAAKTLAIAVRSILQQTFADWELLIVEDGSNDATLAVASKFHDPRIRLIADGFHAGLPTRLNQCVRLSRGKYFARMDADDVSYPERLERQLAGLEPRADVELIAASVVVFQSDGHVIGERKLRDSHTWLCRRPWASFSMPHPTWMGRCEWFRAHPYNPAAVRCEDQELLLRTYQHSQFAAVEQVLLGYREDRISLINAAQGRLHYATIAARHFCRGGQLAPAIASVAGHGAKLLLEAAAVVTGLNHRLARHRATPADDSVIRDWEQVWAAVSDPEGCSLHGGDNHFLARKLQER